MRPFLEKRDQEEEGRVGEGIYLYKLKTILLWKERSRRKKSGSSLHEDNTGWERGGKNKRHYANTKRGAPTHLRKKKV